MGCHNLLHIENQSPLSVAHRENEVFSNSSTVSYRYGFNGMEKDDDLAAGKSGMSYDFGARLYNPGLGRWLALDPIMQPYQSPYSGLDNNPIIYYDPDGKIVISGTIVVGAGVYYAFTFVASAVSAYLIMETGAAIIHELQDITPTGSSGTHVTVPDPYAVAPGVKIGDGSGGTGPPKPDGGLPRGLRAAFYGMMGAKLIHTYHKTVTGGTYMSSDPLDGDQPNKLTVVDSDKHLTLTMTSTTSVKVHTEGVMGEVKTIEEKITAKITYSVQKNDNLTKIANANNTTVGKLMELNGIAEADKNDIKIGQSLIIAESEENYSDIDMDFKVEPLQSDHNNEGPTFMAVPASNE